MCTPPRIGVRPGRTKLGRMNGRPIISCVQVQKQPLERLQSLIGGNLKRKPARKNSNTQAAWVLTLSSSEAPGWMMTLWTLMSPRRRQQIERALAFWKTIPASPYLRKTALNTCIRGHKLTTDNVYMKPDGERCCRVCRVEQARAAEQMRKSDPVRRAKRLEYHRFRNKKLALIKRGSAASLLGG